MDLRKLKENGHEILNITFDREKVGGYFGDSVVKERHVTKLIVADKEVLSIPASK